MRHTKRQVLERARREFVILDRLVRRLSPADWKREVSRPPGRDRWTVKDALAHIVYWKTHTARVMRGEPRPPELRGLDVDQLNRLVYLRWRDRRPADVVAWHRQVQAEVLRTLTGLPAAWFGRKRHGAQWPADLDGHSSAHRRKDIEAALSAPGPSRARRRRQPGSRGGPAADACG